LLAAVRLFWSRAVSLVALDPAAEREGRARLSDPVPPALRFTALLTPEPF